MTACLATRSSSTGPVHLLLALFALLLLTVAEGRAAGAASQAGCAPGGRVTFVCDLRNVEDLVRIEATPWVLASQFVAARGRPGGFYLINVEDRRTVEVAPDFGRRADRRFADCPGAPQAALFAAHGISVRPSTGRRREVYAVNHGGRESVEVFDLDARTATPTLIWKGCVLVPDGVSPNAVTYLPNGGFAVTSFGERTDKETFAKMTAGKKTGYVVEWSPRTGWSEVAGSRLAAPNGILVSADGRTLYVAGWGDRTLHLLPRGGKGAPRSIALDGIHPDNIHLASDGALLIAGQSATPSAIFACSSQPVCQVDSRVLKVDPRALQVTMLVDLRGSPAFGGASAAIEVDGELWIGSFRGDRVAVVSRQ